MISDINKYVDFLTEHSITEHQFLILWLVHTKDTENIKKYKQCFGNFNTQAILALIDRGWIDDFGITRDTQSYNIYDFIVTDKFVKNVVIDEEDSYEEICKAYPKWLSIKGNKIPSITGDPYKLAKEYFKCHKGNKIAHNRIIDITKRFFKDKQYAQVKIENYIMNRMWNLYEEELNNGAGFNAFKTL